MSENNHDYDNSQFLQYLKELDLRVSQLEAKIGIENSSEHIYSFSDNMESQNSSEEKPSADLNFGENWFANLAIIVFAIFFTFFMVKPYEEVNQLLPTIFGGIIAGGIIVFSKWLKSYSAISRSFFGLGFLLLYISILRLFHFSPDPAMDNIIVESLLLFAFSSIVIYIATNRKSYYLNLVGMVLFSLTSLILNVPIIHFIILTLLSILIIYNYLKLDFENVSYVVAGIAVIYISHLVLAVNNPIIGNKLSIVNTPLFNFFFLLTYMAIFSFGLLTKQLETKSEGFNSIISFVNAISCFLLYSVIAFVGFRESAAFLYILFSIISLLVAVLFWVKTKSKYSTYIYTILSFITLSLAILVAIDLPTAFVPLIWQSVLVIVFAIWFNSKGIVVSNFAMFLTIFTAYILASQSFGVISLSFGITALISARLLNWQKKRLVLRTEMMRNIYLLIALFSIPFSIISSFATNYIGLSLIFLSMIYYLLSTYLKNIKYRWMGHFTLLGTIIYVLVFALNSIENTFQIITLSALTIALISVSVFFTKMKLNSKTELN